MLFFSDVPMLNPPGVAVAEGFGVEVEPKPPPNAGCAEAAGGIPKLGAGVTGACPNVNAVGAGEGANPGIAVLDVVPKEGVPPKEKPAPGVCTEADVAGFACEEPNENVAAAGGSV